MKIDSTDLGVGFIITLFLASLVAVGVGLTRCSKAINKTLTKYDNADTKMRATLGSKILMGKDSLTVVDYTLVKGTFTLSSGVKVDTSVVYNK